MQRRITLAFAILVALGATVALLSGERAGRTFTSVLTVATASVDGPYYFQRSQAIAHAGERTAPAPTLRRRRDRRGMAAPDQPRYAPLPLGRRGHLARARRGEAGG
jgi:hypothetical protein